MIWGFAFTSYDPTSRPHRQGVTCLFIVVVLNKFRLQTYGNDDRRVAEGATELYVSQNP
ncbi:hypothetical protein D3OALGA1CA_3982 [Olavius algarvensis associated proteobacterium Delta 3]|nr:hypothetical protein D3OALGB2SA_3380 [Olavius algarvensis associated proteobacterium Delta 3]CAB5143213.1 hypothetical protein D3OALGA1CA_3982 [Olavius algarvensis associated proteobacterium Delta 3]